MMEAAGIEPANDSDRVSESSGRTGAEVQPPRGRASGRQPGEARAIGAGHRSGHLEGAPTSSTYTAGSRQERTAPALGPRLPDPKGKVNGDADLRESEPSACRQGSQHRAPIGESVLRRRLSLHLMGTSVAQVDATYGHLVPDSELDNFDATPVESEVAAATGPGSRT